MAQSISSDGFEVLAVRKIHVFKHDFITDKHLRVTDLPVPDNAKDNICIPIIPFLQSETPLVGADARADRSNNLILARFGNNYQSL